MLVVCGGAVRPTAPPPRLRPIPATRIAVVAPAVVILLDGRESKQRRADLETRLRARIESVVARRGRAVVDRPADDAARAARIHRALVASPVVIHRELVGRASSPRGTLPATDLRPFAAEAAADLVIVARLLGVETGVASRVADSAVSFLGEAAVGAVSLSPSKIVRAAVNAPKTKRGSNLRVALVQPVTGEILWANLAIVKSEISPAVVDELVGRAFADFPVR